MTTGPRRIEQAEKGAPRFATAGRWDRCAEVDPRRYVLCHLPRGHAGEHEWNHAAVVRGR